MYSFHSSREYRRDSSYGVRKSRRVAKAATPSSDAASGNNDRYVRDSPYCKGNEGRDDRHDPKSNDDPRAEPLRPPRVFWTNADDRLFVDPLGWIEGGDGIVECRDAADVRPQPSSRTITCV
jgi:hypothetical protein